MLMHNLMTSVGGKQPLFFTHDTVMLCGVTVAKERQRTTESALGRPAD